MNPSKAELITALSGQQLRTTRVGCASRKRRAPPLLGYSSISQKNGDPRHISGILSELLQGTGLDAEKALRNGSKKKDKGNVFEKSEDSPFQAEQSGELSLLFRNSYHKIMGG